MSAKEEIVARLRQCPEAVVGDVLLGFIREMKLPEEKAFDSYLNYFNNVLLGEPERQAEALAAGDRENACRIAIRAWGRVQLDKYFILQTMGSSEKGLRKLLSWHRQYEGMQGEVDRLSGKLEALADKSAENLWSIVRELESGFHRYLFTYVDAEGKEEIVEPTWGEAMRAMGYEGVSVKQKVYHLK